MSRNKQVVLNLLVVAALLVSLVGIAPVSAVPLGESAVQLGANAQSPKPPAEMSLIETSAPEQPIDKIDPLLREIATTGGNELVDLYVSVVPGTDVSQYLINPIVRPVVFQVQNIYGQARASTLLKLASVPGVVAVVARGLERDKPFDPEARTNEPTASEKLARLSTLRSRTVPYAQAPTPEVQGQGWFDVLDGHKSKEAWTKGFTGEGVIVGVLDDGIDFAHPDLQGTYAWVTDANSPYYGWPMAFSQVSMYYFASDVLGGSTALASGFNGSRWSTAQITRTGQTVPWEPTKVRFSFQPLNAPAAHTYTAPKTSKSGVYRLGSFHEKNLLDIYDERVAVLVVDEHTAGIYDTVYVDLDNNYDFTDEKPNTKDSPTIYRDMDVDGYADISGGLLVWISDGQNPPPAADWLWGIDCSDSSATMQGCPDNGSLVLFAGPFDEGYTHGTQCASNIAGQGVVNGGLSAPAFRVGGMVQGAAPSVGLMDFGNHYYSGTDEDEFIVAALGYDGVPNSGDEVQITSNSYGSFTQMWGGWGYIGRLVTALNTTIAPSTVWVFSGGNEGPGYGPQEGDAGPTIIKAGTSTQFGSTNWDSIMSADQIVYGDPGSFGSKGPNRDGASGLDILGNGGRGAGDEGLNYFGFNGAESWDTWGGTSRSAPVVAGNLALLYQAYKARYGVWPTWDQVLSIVKSSATNSVSAPFFQGGGVINSDRATDVAAGIYGVYATPDEWQVGNWQGVEYLNFAKVAKPGSTYTKTYEVKNPSGYNISVSLTDGYMKLITKTQMTFTTSPENQESSFNFHSPDYLMALNPALIPADAEVMIVRYAQPYASFDPNFDYNPGPSNNPAIENSWRFMLYNWTDQNDDGKLWTDTNANGVVNHVDLPAVDNDGFHKVDYANSEIQQGEYIRMDYEFGGISVPIIVHDPLDRMADGYFFGFQHRYNRHIVTTTTFYIGVEFYKRADWPWLGLSTSSLAVPANGTATFNAIATIPANAAPGAYEGVIFMNDPGDSYHAAHESALPVVVNVIADLSNAGATTLGNTPMADTMYQNAWTNGYFNWYGGGWTGAGDWRHYFLDITSSDVMKQNLLIHSSWTYTPTDFNTWVLGPTEDCASNGAASCAWYSSDIGQPDPALFGPYTLQPIASSGPFLAGAAYPFNTSTGGPADWVKAPLEKSGLHEVALHNVLFAGIDLAEQFRVDVGTIAFDPEMDPAVGSVSIGSINADAYTNTGQIDVNITPSIGVPDLNFTLAGGLATTHVNHTTLITDSNQCGSGAQCAETVWTVVPVAAPGTTRLVAYIPMPAGEDIDLFVYRDANGNNVFDAGIDALVGSSTNSAGNDDFVTVNNPTLGVYLVGILGWDISVPTLSLDWYHEITAPGPLPTEPLTVFSNTVQITQTQFVTSATTYTYTVVADNRASALYAWVGNFTDTADIDLYVSDHLGNIVASSATTATTELVTVTPAAGYRFVAGTQYTVWVHGKSIAAPPADVDLQIWWDHLNVWLSSTHPDVHVNAIQPNETVSVTLHFDKSVWPVGQLLSARLVGDMSVMPNAFDELVIITRANPPATDLAAFATKSGVSVHGPGQNVFSAPYNLPGHQLLVGPSEPVTYTVRFTNTSDTAGTFYVEDYWGENNFTFDQFLGITPTNYGFYNSSGFRILYITTTLQPNQGYEFTYRNVVTSGIPLGSGYLNFVDVYDDESGELLFEGFSQGGWLIAHYRGFSTSSSTGFTAYTQKLSLPSEVLPGETYTYRLSMLNPSSIAQPIKITDTLPAGVTYVSSNPPMTYDPISHTLYLSITVPGHGSLQTNVDIQVTASATATVGTQYQNTARFYNGLTDALITTKSATTEIAPSAELGLTKTSDRLLGRVGDTVKYQIVFKNMGPLAADNATFIDRVPLYLDVITSTILPSTVSYMTGTHTLEWTGDLAVGQTITVTYDAKVNGTAHPLLALINLASIEADNGTGVNYGSAVTEVVAFFRIYLPLIRR